MPPFFLRLDNRAEEICYQQLLKGTLVPWNVEMLASLGTYTRHALITQR